ncbi:MAG: glycosyl transferase [Phycisphaerae bacterium SM23_30]|nr:MAG: glycosyl transferase [Phycisphaerae bacterium SM23_30]
MVDKSVEVSVVAPLYNECDNVVELVESVSEVMSRSGSGYELILIDDGSTDGTLEELLEVQKRRPYVKVIQFRRNFGQTAALAAGFDHATGEVIVPLDGDLQNDPGDIPRLMAKLQEGYDVVSGWRRKRKDRLLSKKIPSWGANKLIGFITGVKLHDYGCTMKAYRREVVDHLNLYGEMHRFIPAIAHWSGARVTEMEVNHRRRRRGRTKYGLSRTLKVILDLVTVKFLGTFGNRPLHVFGGVGLLALLFSFLSGAVVIYQKYVSADKVDVSGNPLFTLTFMFLMMSVMFLLMGLLAEMMCRTYHESQNKPTYVIRKIYEPAVTEEGLSAGDKE